LSYTQANFFFLATPDEAEKLARIAALVQHRCHPRAADVVHTLVNLKLDAFPARLCTATVQQLAH
jgi:hypothetical protein